MLPLVPITLSKEDSMRLARFLPLVIAAAVLGLAPESHAVSYWFDGNTCQPKDETLYYEHTFTGTRNDTEAVSSGDWFWCPVGGHESTTVDVNSATVRYYDGNAFASIKCELGAKTDSGTGYFSGFMYSCSTAGGCSTDSGPGATGYGYLQWTNPLNSGSSMSNVAVYTFHCWLHGYKVLDEANQGDSYVMAYSVDQTGA